MDDTSRSAATATSGVGLPSEALHGRDEELQMVQYAMGSFASGPGRGAPSLRALVISGDPGIGKTSLWRHGIRLAQRTRVRTLSTTCVRPETEMPYACWEDLFGQLFDEHHDDLPDLQRDALDGAFHRKAVSTMVNPQVVAAGAVTLLRQVVERGALLLAVDDLHWIDHESRTCLAYALRRLSRGPIRVLLATRERSALWQPDQPQDDGTSALLTGAVAGDDLRVLRLGPLPTEAIGRMVTDRTGVLLTAEENSRLSEETGGNPFWALQFVQEPVGGRSAPLALEALISSRTADLSRGAIEAACLVAALGRATPSLIAEAVDPAMASASQVERDLDVAISAGLLSLSGPRLVPSHPLIAAALLASLPPFRRRQLYRHAAELADSAEQRALRLLDAAEITGLAGGPTGSAELRAERVELLHALDLAVTAARQRGAAASAVRFASHALVVAETCSPINASRGSVLAEEDHESERSLSYRRLTIAELQYLAGELDAALEMFSTVELTHIDPDRLERAGPVLAQAANETGGRSSAHLVIDRLEHLGHRGCSKEDFKRHEALISTLRSDLQCGSTGDRRARAERAVSLAEEARVGLSLRRRALGALASALLVIGEPREAVLARFDALGPGQSDSGPETEVIRGLSRLSDLDFTGARHSFAADFERLLFTGNGPAIALASAMVAVTDVLMGRPAAAESILARSENYVDRTTLDRLGHVNARGLLYVVRGEHELLEELLERVEAKGNRSIQGVAWASRLRGLLALQRQDFDSGVAQLTHFAEIADKYQFYDFHFCAWNLVDLAEALIACGQHDRAEKIADDIEARAPRVRSAAARAVGSGWIQRVRGLVAGARDDLDRAEHLVRGAVELHDGCPLRFEHGRSLVALADTYRLRGDHEAAAEQRRRAHEIFRQIGYRWWADHTASADNAALSPSERAVADHVSRGATNRETAAALNLSVRTVENHLARIYRKLGIRSRAQLSHYTSE